jgi:spore germination protein KC
VKKFKLAALLLLYMLILAGCWDKVEIEDRIFVLGIGVDKATEQDKKLPNDKYVINFASPIVGALKDGGGEAFTTYKTVCSIFSVGLSQMYERMDKKPFFQHTRILIFGEDLLKDDRLFRQLLDAVGRNHDFQRNMYVFVAPGKAEDAFKIKPKFAKLLSTYITGIAENNQYQSSIYRMTAYELYNNLIDTEGDTVIPTLTSSKEEANVSGVGIIKDYKLIGYMQDEDSEALNWLNNKAKGGVISVQYNGVEIPYKYNELSTKLSLDRVEGNQLYFTYDMAAEGSAEEYIWDEKLLDSALLNTLQTMLEKKIESRSKTVIAKLQEEYKMDLLGVGEYLRKHHPDIYESIEKDYENYFVNHMVFEIKTKVFIRRVGTIQ